MTIPSFAVLDDYAARKLITRVDLDDLSIYNYTEATTYTHAWDDVTRVCRGLVLNRVTGEVVARAFDKFFNHGEHGVNAVIPDRSPDVVTVKHDGSLGIGFRHNGQFCWTTRGSFYSPQAAIAQAIWEARYAHVRIPDELTPLVEIIAPGTRNVVSYGDREDLILLGIRNRHTGVDLPYDVVVDWAHAWGLPVTESVGGTLDSIVDAAARLDHQHEGFVVRWGDYRVKVKSAEYMAVARLVSGLNERRIADIWYAGRLDLLEPLPEEHRGYALERMAVLDEETGAARSEVAALIDRVGPITDRKAFVMAVGQAHPLFGLAMSHHLGKPVDAKAHVYRARFDSRPRPMESE